MFATAAKKFFQPSVLRYARRIATSGRLSSSDLVTHRDTCDNNPDVPFEFTEANMCRIASLVEFNYPKGAQRSVICAAMDIVQRQIGWIPISAMHKVADILYIPRIRVYEWATFYTMCKRRYRGKFNVKVCVTTPCMLRGSDELLQAAEQFCGCKEGGLSLDGMFGVDTVQCQGACANAPVVAIDDDYYEDMTIDALDCIIRTLRAGCIPRPGPQSGRFAAEPCTGPTTLHECPPPPGFKVLPEISCPQCCQ